MSDKDKDTSPINLAEMSDDQISNMDFTTLEDPELQASDENQGAEDSDTDNTEEDQSADGNDTDDTDTDDTGGAGSVDDSSGEVTDGADSSSDEVDDDTGTDDQSGEQQQESSSSNQDEEQSTAESQDTDTSSSKVDYKIEYAKVMAPLRAANKTIKIDTVDDLRRLAQMGVDYSRKMENMKPYQRVLKTLEKNDLIDIDKVNFLIDLSKGNPDAVKKFLKDSEIDPMDLDLEDNADYKPNDHMVSDAEIDLDTVLEDIRSTDTFDRTVDTITNKWDTASRKVLMDTPKIIAVINDHMASGIFDQITEQVTKDRLFGRLAGLSDLDAYRTVGDAIQEKGGFNAPNSNETSAAGDTGQGFSQDSGSGSAKAENARKNRRRAASPTKGSASAGKPKIDLAKMSDEDVENFDLSTL